MDRKITSERVSVAPDKITPLRRTYGVTDGLCRADKIAHTPKFVCRICGSDAELVNKEWTCEHSVEYHKSESAAWERRSTRYEAALREATKQREELLEACKALVNIATHPRATLIQIRMIAEESRAAIVKAEGKTNENR